MSVTDVAQGRTLRRSRVYSGRIKRSVFGVGLRHPAVFLHLPKCGGTSLSEALYSTVPIHKRIGVIDAMSTRRAASILAFGKDDPWRCHDDLEHGHYTFDLRERILLTHGCWNSALLHGHVLLTERLREHLLSKYKLLTIMRDPVARTISNYRMAIAAGIADPDPNAWLQSPISRAHSTTYLRYLSGQHSVPASEEAACLRRATKALQDFALIGFLEEIERFTQAFEHIFGAALRLHKYNQAKGPEVTFARSQLDQIHDICTADLTLYKAAQELQQQRRD